MLSHLAVRAGETARHTARTALIGAGAAVCLCIGAGFLTAAFWLFLVSVTTALNAALILGGFYSGIGLILIAILSIRSRERRIRHAEHLAAAKRPAPGQAEYAGLIAAFMTGLSAGRKARS